MISENCVNTLIVICGIILKFSNICHAVEVGLPLIQISHDDDLGDDYPELREEVHLEDFFWTGSGDGPPDYLKKVHTGISKGKDVVVKTETVVATVYVDGNNEVDIPICLDCYGQGTVGIDGTWTGVNMPPLNYSATDRRYWLLTVMSGFYTQKDNPILEEKLARLYRLAFTRQQTRHLGINGAQHISGIEISTAGRDRRHSESTTTKEPSDYDSELIDMHVNNDPLNKNSQSPYPININSELMTSSEENVEDTTLLDYPSPVTDMQAESSDILSQVATAAPWELIQENDKSQKLLTPLALKTHTLPLMQAQRLSELNFRDDQVRVIIHNVTQLTADDVQERGSIGTGVSGTLYDEDINEKIDERPLANQTELIYSVFVNGRPVLAVTAANDMKLVSESEVSTVMGKEIFMKAEPYLREPQATPLAPATHSGTDSGFIDSIQNNPILVIVSSIAILLLLLLLIALLLMGRSHVRHKQKEVNRTTSRNELLSETQSARPTSTISGLDTGRTTTQSRDVGIQNFSFENENGNSAREPRIHFPGPPAQRTRRTSITSSDNTSDSSVYCPINPPTADVQRMLDEKAENLFERHKTRRHNQYDRAEGHEDAVYTTVISEKKRDKSRKHKPKRRYLSENRVGSLETSPVQSQQDYSDDEARRSYSHFERTNEAYNPHNNYHRNKLLHQKTIYGDRDDAAEPNSEAINKEIIKALQPAEKSSDSGSIGSFLSMQSVKAFPKTTLPEPLNRVLEPVFVTYYDNIENVHQAASKNKKRSTRDALDSTTIATIESFPTPKAPQKFSRFASQSDNPDPGVVGPIVWERHKKRLSADDILDNEEDNKVYTPKNMDYYSPSRDPAAMRNQYEGLLEGALQMYSSQDDLPMPLPNRDFTNQRKPTKRELRGSSAGASNCNLKSSAQDNRPSTAQPEKTTKSNHSTQPPSPNLGAWGSGGGSTHGSHSPLVRPMSAGPFHRPADLQSTNMATRPVHDLSTAPLIEAIQKELRKFQNDPK
ncbi:uncharacterized protein LOC111680996 isoform X2 [Lucilia cuprina]|uniref:uncharacterized protein LOC111680996 isoform X2 n=1 Tax=Lucilia cuprina TaxID=7375 RepID=UPI001F052937|nr:uncharacterized protein LOC111680996 isoform X2 [Lucilia cuprina]